MILTKDTRELILSKIAENDKQIELLKKALLFETLGEFWHSKLIDLSALKVMNNFYKDVLIQNEFEI